MRTLFPYQSILNELRIRIARGEYREGRLPSERDLMAEFGVHRATVRRALGVLEEEGYLYRDATRGRCAVPAVIDETSKGGSAVIDKTSKGSLALVVRQWESSTGPTNILRGLTRVSREADRSVIWLDEGGKLLRRPEPMPSPEVLKARGIDAVMIWPELPADRGYLRSLQAAMPLVVLDRHVPGFHADFVGFDDLSGGRRITEHLLKLGHRRIGFVSTEPYLTTTQMRIEGYLMALEDAGVAPWPPFHGEGGRPNPPSPMLSGFLDGDGDPLTAIVCANDDIAARLIVQMRAHGRRVPEDIAVTGFGNMLAPLLDALQLTTMAQPFERMGYVAGEMALARLNGHVEGIQEVELPMELIVRRSCGAR